MKDISILVLMVFQICLTGCTGQMFVLKPEGDRAIISTKDGIDFTAELLAVNEDVLYVNIISGNHTLGIAHDEILIGFELDNIRDIRIQGYRNNQWVAPWVVFQVIPPILLGIAASMETADAVAVWAVFSIPALISGTTLGFGGTKNPAFSNDFTPYKISELKKYVRYPMGLNEGQLNIIAESHGQSGYRVHQ